MPPLTTLVSCVNWRGISFSSMEAEVNPKGPETPHTWSFLKLVHRFLLNLKNLLEADKWIRVMDQTFGLIWCTETQKPLFATQQLRGPARTRWGNFTAIQPRGHLVTWAEFKQAFREHYVPEGVLHMKLEEFIRLKQGGDSVMQYLNKFNHLSQHAIDQVDTDLKKKNCFMRGLNDRLQRKMATCLDLTYSRAISTTLSVEAKNSGQGKTKRYGGEGLSQGSEKRSRLVILPFNPNRSSPRPSTYPFKQPVFIRPTPALAQNNQLSAPGARFPALLNFSNGYFNCGKSRHFIKDCPYPKQNKSNFQ
jgi:hypothetical protein